MKIFRLILLSILLLAAPVFQAEASLDSRLIDAAEAGETTEISKLLSDGASVNAHSPIGKTALMFAAQEGHLEAVEIHRRSIKYEGRARVPQLQLSVSLGADGYPTAYEIATADGLAAVPDLGGGFDLDSRIMYLLDQEPRSKAKAYNVVGGNKAAFNATFSKLEIEGQVTLTTPKGHNWTPTESGKLTLNRALERDK